MTRTLFSKRLGRVIEDIPSLRTAAWMLEAALLGLLWLISSCLTPAAASRLGATFMATFGPLVSRNKTLLANLAVMFPDLSEQERRRLARRVWANLGAVTAEYPHLRFIITSRVKLHITDAARRVMEGREPAVYMAGHLANWEVIAGCIVRQGIPVSVVYNPQQNRFLDRMIQYQRRAIGCEFIIKGDAFRQIIQALSQQRSIGILPDQRADAGPGLPFFGREAPTTVIPARLAHRVGCPVIPIRAERLPGCWFRITFDDPIDIHRELKGKEASFKTTGEFLERLEGWIREHPEQWLSVKRRWPKDRPKDRDEETLDAHADHANAAD
ncbi:MAG: hypothetical protein V3U43_05925 [Pseudomonadales bacterium]